MPSTWLLTIALAAASSAGQEIAYRQPSVAPMPSPPQESKNPYKRLFRFGADDPKTGVRPPLFRTVPGKRSVGANGATPREDEAVDIVCGMTVIRKSPHIDRGIALPADRGANIAVRRIEPEACGPRHRVSPK